MLLDADQHYRYKRFDSCILLQLQEGCHSSMHVTMLYSFEFAFSKPSESFIEYQISLVKIISYSSRLRLL